MAREFRKFFIYGEEDCYRTAEALQAQDMNIAHFLGHAVEFSVFSETINGICERAHQKGIPVTLEFMPGTAMPDLATVSALQRATGMDKAQLVVDFWHVARSGATAEDIKKLPPKAIRSVQFSDRTEPKNPGVYKPMTGRDLPGEGELPLADLLRASLANNPDLRLELEIVNNPRVKDMAPNAAAKEMMDATKRWAAQAA
jgi:sugar phosphate isomerase/epimerase